MTDEATCDDDNPCTDDACLGEAGCQHVALDGAECLDGDPCTVTDQCVAGVCVGQAVNCDDENPCTDDACLETGGCIHVPNTLPCDDGDPCSVGDHCAETLCSGTFLDCDDGNLCTDDGCAEEGCTHAPNAAPCDDGDACTPVDQCSGGVCIGVGVPDCDDGDTCTADSCAAALGCQSEAITPCCGNGITEGPGETCDDGNLIPGDGCDGSCQQEIAQGTCSVGANLISTAPSGTMVLCDDPTDSTCEQDNGSLCPVGWHLCSRDEFNNRNGGWTYPYSGTKGLGTIHCRNGGGAGHFTLYYDSGITNFGQDSSYNCGYGSSLPICSSNYGCNETQHWALCCKPSPSCGNGVVDSPEEICDDGNFNETDACFKNCTTRMCPSGPGS